MVGSVEHDKRRRRGRGVALAAGVVLAAGAALVVTQASGEPTAQAHLLVRALSIGPDSAAERIDELAGRASAAESGALADREVTLGEYRAAVKDTIECFRSEVDVMELPEGFAGRPLLTVHGPTVSEDDFAVTYSYSLDTSHMTLPDDLGPDDLELVTSLERGCQDRFQRRIERAYQVGLLSDRDYVSSITARFDTCAEAAGVTSIGAREQDVLETLRASVGNLDLASCLRRMPSVADGFAIAGNGAARAALPGADR